MPEVREPDIISVQALLSAVWAARLAVLLGFVLGAALGAVLAYSMTPVYRAEAVAVPVKSDGLSGISGALGQLGGLASVAGVDLHGGDNSVEYLEFLRSRTLTERFIVENNLLPVLYPKRWNEAAKTWRSDERPPTILSLIHI